MVSDVPGRWLITFLFIFILSYVHFSFIYFSRVSGWGRAKVGNGLGAVVWHIIDNTQRVYVTCLLAYIYMYVSIVQDRYICMCTICTYM